MPNWCTTDYALSGERANAEKCLKDLQNIIRKNRNSDKMPFSFKGNPEWLGYIVQDLFTDTKIEEIPCRGEISYLDDELCFLDDKHAAVKLTTETAWVSCSELFKKLAKKYDLNVFYYSEEPGCEIFETNDSEGVFFDFKYRIDSECDGIEYYKTFENLARDIKNITGKEANTMNDIEKILDDYNDGNTFLIVNLIEIV